MRRGQRNEGCLGHRLPLVATRVAKNHFNRSAFSRSTEMHGEIVFQWFHRIALVFFCQFACLSEAVSCKRKIQGQSDTS